MYPVIHIPVVLHKSGDAFIAEPPKPIFAVFHGGARPHSAVIIPYSRLVVRRLLFHVIVITIPQACRRCFCCSSFNPSCFSIASKKRDRAVGIGCGTGGSLTPRGLGISSPPSRLQGAFGREIEGKIPGTIESRQIDYRMIDITACDVSQLIRELRHRNILAIESSRERGAQIV